MILVEFRGSVLWKSAVAPQRAANRRGLLWSVRLSVTGTNSALLATGNHLLASSKTKLSTDCFIMAAQPNHSPGNKPLCKADCRGVPPPSLLRTANQGRRADRSAAAAPLTTGHLSACTAALSPLQLSAQCERLRSPQINQGLTFLKFGV